METLESGPNSVRTVRGCIPILLLVMIIPLYSSRQNVEYRLRFAGSEWSKIEYELTRERGLWGPEKSSALDKWMVDPVEGEMGRRDGMVRGGKERW